MYDPIVISGIGLVTAVGNDRETTWRNLREGVSGVRQLSGVAGLPDGMLLAADVRGIRGEPGRLRDYPVGKQAAGEALADSGLLLRSRVDRTRIGVIMSSVYGDSPGVAQLRGGQVGLDRWHEEFLASATLANIANDFGLVGPRIGNATACATGTICVVTAMRAIEDGQCDAVLAGAITTIQPLLAAGFYNMRVLAKHDDPTAACRPFDVDRTGFVMGEGAGMLVIERASSARARGARIYAELTAGKLACDAHHVTDLSTDASTLIHLLGDTLKKAKLAPGDVSYINAHGTGTTQNDIMESRGIRQAFGAAADDLCVSSIKGNIGHLVNAAGAVELAITALALRDGFAPPTRNLVTPDPECDLDCIPFVGRQRAFEHAVKISIAFGGHLAAVALRRWDGAEEQVARPPLRVAA